METKHPSLEFHCPATQEDTFRWHSVISANEPMTAYLPGRTSGSRCYHREVLITARPGGMGRD